VERSEEEDGKVEGRGENWGQRMMMMAVMRRRRKR